MTDNELTTTLFFQAICHYFAGNEDFAEEVLLSAMNNHFSGSPMPELSNLLQ